jgi:hypothetical protein
MFSNFSNETPYMSKATRAITGANASGASNSRNNSSLRRKRTKASSRNEFDSELMQKSARNAEELFKKSRESFSILYKNSEGVAETGT